MLNIELDGKFCPLERIIMKSLCNIYCVFTLVVLIGMPDLLIAKTWIVDQKNPDAKDTNIGSEQSPLLTINRAAQLAEPGDTVEIFPGVYRERVAPARGGIAEKRIVYRAVYRNTVIVKGSDVWKPKWEKVKGVSCALYKAQIDLDLFENWRPHRDPRLATTPSPFHEEIIPSNGQDKLLIADKLKGTSLTIQARPVQGNNWTAVIGQIYADACPLLQLLSMEDVQAIPGSYMVDEDGDYIFVHLPQSTTSVDEVNWEITTREKIFAPFIRGLGYIVLDGLIFEHAANQAPWPSVGAVSVRNGHNWILRHCTIRQTQSVGLDIGGEWFDGKRLFGDKPNSHDHLIEDCLIYDHGLTGIYGYEVHDCILRRNEIYNNNRLGFTQSLNARWEEYAGVKLLHAYRNRIEDNYIHDNYAFGLWLDNQWAGTRISRNLISDNQFGGIFIEYGRSPDTPLMIDNNIILFTDEGSGIYCHDASDVKVVRNLLYANKDYGLWMWAVSPRGGKHGGANNNVAWGNVFYGNGVGNVGYPAHGQINQNNQSDYNLFANKTWARSADVATFSLHESYSNPAVTRQDVAHQIADKLKGTNGVNADLSYEFWRSQPSRALTFSQWQAVTGNDNYSISSAAFKKSLYRPQLCQLEFIPNETWQQIAVPPYQDVELDYFGKPYPADEKTVPGPFVLLDSDFKRVVEFVSFGRDSDKDLISKISQQKGRQCLTLWPKVGQ